MMLAMRGDETMKRWGSPLFPVIVAVCVAGAVAVGAVWASGTGRSAAVARAAASCSSVPLPPADQEVNTILDKENGLLTYSFYDRARGADASATIDYKSALCLGVPQLTRLISHAVATDAEAQTQTCASIRERVAANVDTVRGVRINLEAAKQYISEWC